MLPASFRVEGPPGAPVLILLNSLGTSAAMWDPQMPVWRDRFRVVRCEHPGHGGTAADPGPYRIADLADRVVELLNHLGEPTASICGLSLGGMVALSVATRHPDRVERLVLACTAAHLPPASGWAERAATVREQGTGVLLEAQLGRWFTPGFPARRPDIAALVATMLGAAEPEGYAGCCEAIAGMDQRADLAAVNAPTLVLAGAEDPVTPPVMALELATGIPGAALTVLAGAAHLANLEQPDRFTAAVTDHLTGLAVTRGRAARAAVLGEAHVARSDAARTDFDAPFTDFITRYAWGDIWTRPGLDRRSRSMLTLALLTGLGRTEEIAMHVRGARTNGLSEEEIAEVLLHTAVYAGVPTANRAFAIAKQTLAELAEAAGPTGGPGAARDTPEQER
jgi:3-oxoadipate enol-lactonase/4-carboxymuconolactone decarboxylase